MDDKRFKRAMPEGEVERVARAREAQVQWALANGADLTKVFDIGGGDGSFGHVLAKVMPEDWYGYLCVEPEPDSYPSPHPATCRYSLEGFCRYWPNRAGTVFLNHVLEHLESPVESLRLLHGVVSTEGTLFIAVPHATDAWATSNEEHLWLFNGVTLARVSRRAGWEVKASTLFHSSPDKGEVWMMLTKAKP